MTTVKPEMTIPAERRMFRFHTRRLYDYHAETRRQDCTNAATLLRSGGRVHKPPNWPELLHATGNGVSLGIPFRAHQIVVDVKFDAVAIAHLAGALRRC
jgi:hypothetical protein